jgi:hypothetical protein
MALSCGHIEVLRWARAQGCPEGYYGVQRAGS